MPKTPALSFINLITTNESVRNHLCNGLIHAVQRTPRHWDKMDNRMRKDSVVKHYLSRLSSLNLSKIDSESYDFFHRHSGARISLKMQNEIFPRCNLRKAGLTTMKSLRLKNGLCEHGQSGESLDTKSDLVIMAVQPNIEETDQPFMVGFLAACNIEESMIKFTAHDIKMTCPYKSWDLLIECSNIPCPPNSKKLNKIVRQSDREVLSKLLKQ